MKERPREESRFLTFFACLLLNAGLTLGSIFCPITAFRLPVDEVQLAVLLVLVCLLLSVLYRFRWAGLFLLGLWILTPGRSIPSGTGGAGAGRPVPLHPAHYHLPHCLPLCPAARLETQNLRECHPAVGPLGRGFGLRQRLGDPAAAERGPCPFAGRAAPGPCVWWWWIRRRISGAWRSSSPPSVCCS